MRECGVEYQVSWVERLSRRMGFKVLGRKLPCWQQVSVVRTHDRWVLPSARRLPSWARRPWQQAGMVRTHDGGPLPRWGSQRSELSASLGGAYARSRISALGGQPARQYRQRDPVLVDSRRLAIANRRESTPTRPALVACCPQRKAVGQLQPAKGCKRPAVPRRVTTAPVAYAARRPRA